MSKKQLFDAEFEFVRETPAALCVTEDGGKTQIWLPKSQIEYVQNGALVEVTMPIWLAREKSIAGA